MKSSAYLTEEPRLGEKDVSPSALVRCDAARVLLVDDEESILDLFRVILSAGLPGHRIEVAGNGAEAVESFSMAHHAVLLMDMHMPVMDGRKAFLEIQKLCGGRNWEMPCVVFCTGFAPPDAILNVVEHNPRHGLLLKPVSSEALLSAVRSRLR
jgi:CheY-like chemotaxis protein